tara:strand:+ start:914 stop:1249 length:336 start_codon:yes stop_codon:yes gene_type:complete
MNEVLSFDDEAQAYEEIEAMGYHAMAFDFPAEENELHWHDFDSVLYVTSGELTVWVDGGDESVTCRRGAKVVASAGTVHRERTPGYSAIVGFSVRPESISQPVDKPLPVAI